MGRELVSFAVVTYVCCYVVCSCRRCRCQFIKTFYDLLANSPPACTWVFYDFNHAMTTLPKWTAAKSKEQELNKLTTRLNTCLYLWPLWLLCYLILSINWCHSTRFTILLNSAQQLTFFSAFSVIYNLFDASNQCLWHLNWNPLANCSWEIC